MNSIGFGQLNLSRMSLKLSSFLHSYFRRPKTRRPARAIFLICETKSTYGASVVQSVHRLGTSWAADV
jgi:hypothetical protein